MSAKNLTAMLAGMTRREIAAWASAHGLVVLHLTYYGKKALISHVVEQWQWKAATH